MKKIVFILSLIVFVAWGYLLTQLLPKGELHGHEALGILGISIAILAPNLLLAIISCHVGYTRLSYMISAIWIILALISYKPYLNYGSLGYLGISDFVKVGGLPLIIFWGLAWVVKGFKEKQ